MLLRGTLPYLTRSETHLPHRSYSILISGCNIVGFKASDRLWAAIILAQVHPTTTLIPNLKRRRASPLRTCGSESPAGMPSAALSLTLSHTLFFSLSLSRAHTHTHSISLSHTLSLAHAHTHSLAHALTRRRSQPAWMPTSTVYFLYPTS